MTESYDHLQESGEPKELGAKVQLAGDVVPLPIGDREVNSALEDMNRLRASSPSNTKSYDSKADQSKVVPYRDFMAKKFPYK